MPIESDGLDQANTLIEYRGIRSGQRATGKAPTKTPPRVRHTLKTKGSDFFDIDVPVMEKAAQRLGIKNWKEIKEIPILLTSDKIMGEGGVLFLERALYSRRGRLCGSAMGEESAVQRVDVSKYAASKGKNIVPLKPFREAPCSHDCPLWGENGEKTDCRWRVIMTMQLLDDPIFPSPVHHRTGSRYSIRALYTSLFHIHQATGGLLTGIPLWFRQSEIKVRDFEGKERIIPVSTVDFKGTTLELQELAIELHQRRNALREASNGNLVSLGKGLSFGNLDLDGGELIDDEAEDVGDVADKPGEPEPLDAADKAAADRGVEMQSAIAVLGKKLGYTKARMAALENKHEGDLEAMLAELKSEDPETDFDPSPGAPADATSVEAEDDQTKEPVEDDDDISDLFEDD